MLDPFSIPYDILAPTYDPAHQWNRATKARWRVGDQALRLWIQVKAVRGWVSRVAAISSAKRA